MSEDADRQLGMEENVSEGSKLGFWVRIHSVPELSKRCGG